MRIFGKNREKTAKTSQKRAQAKPRQNESVLTIEQICTELIERGEFTGSYEDLVKHVKMFFNEMSHQLTDDNAKDTGYYSVYLRTRAFARRLAKSVVVDVEEQTEKGYIGDFIDKGTNTVNDRVTPGRVFTVTGNKIRIEGNNADTGVWFVSMMDPSLRFKATKALTENTGSKVSGVVPVIPAGKFTVEILTQYTEGGVLLKEPRAIKSKVTLRNYKILAVKDEK